MKYLISLALPIILLSGFTARAVDIANGGVYELSIATDVGSPYDSSPVKLRGDACTVLRTDDEVESMTVLVSQGGAYFTPDHYAALTGQYDSGNITEGFLYVKISNTADSNPATGPLTATVACQGPKY